MKLLRRTISIILLFTPLSFAQVDSTASGSIEIFLIDSFITPEIPYKFILSFFTSDSCTAKVMLIGEKEYVVSQKLSENHKIEIDLSNLTSEKGFYKYKVFVYDRDGAESQSQLYEVEIPQNIIVSKERDTGLLQVCCFGGIIFGLPAPTYVSKNNEQYFSITKEIPLFSFYSTGFNYPFGYFGVEYAHVFKAERKNFLRVGYKQIIQLPFIKFVSAGINYFTDLKGYNGISPEISLGLFQIQNVFTLFTRYRYNFQPDRGATDFHEFSIGLYSNFFSINF